MISADILLRLLLRSADLYTAEIITYLMYSVCKIYFIILQQFVDGNFIEQFSPILLIIYIGSQLLSQFKCTEHNLEK